MLMTRDEKLQTRSEWRRNNPDKIKASRRRFYKNNKTKIRKWNAEWANNNKRQVAIMRKSGGCKPHNRYNIMRRLSKHRGIVWSISYKYFMQFWKQPCYYCGTDILFIGLDRVNNNKGYVNGNLVACCSQCNYAKRKSSAEEFYNMCKRVVQQHKKGLKICQ